MKYYLKLKILFFKEKYNGLNISKSDNITFWVIHGYKNTIKYYRRIS